MKPVPALLAVLAAGLWLVAMVGMYWLMEIVPVVALFALAGYYAAMSARSAGRSRP